MMLGWLTRFKMATSRSTSLRAELPAWNKPMISILFCKESNLQLVKDMVGNSNHLSTQKYHIINKNKRPYKFVDEKIQTQKGSDKSLFILTRTHSMQIFGEIPFIKPQNNR